MQFVMCVNAMKRRTGHCMRAFSMQSGRWFQLCWRLLAWLNVLPCTRRRRVNAAPPYTYRIDWPYVIGAVICMTVMQKRLGARLTRAGNRSSRVKLDTPRSGLKLLAYTLDRSEPVTDIDIGRTCKL